MLVRCFRMDWRYFDADFFDNTKGRETFIWYRIANLFIFVISVSIPMADLWEKLDCIIFSNGMFVNKSLIPRQCFLEFRISSRSFRFDLKMKSRRNFNVSNAWMSEAFECAQCEHIEIVEQAEKAYKILYSSIYFFKVSGIYHFTFWLRMKYSQNERLHKATATEIFNFIRVIYRFKKMI